MTYSLLPTTNTRPSSTAPSPRQMMSAVSLYHDIVLTLLASSCVTSKTLSSFFMRPPLVSLPTKRCTTPPTWWLTNYPGLNPNQDHHSLQQTTLSCHRARARHGLTLQRLLNALRTRHFIPPLSFDGTSLTLISPVLSLSEPKTGTQYLLLSVYKGYIHVEPMASRTTAHLCVAYLSTVSYISLV